MCLREILLEAVRVCKHSHLTGHRVLLAQLLRHGGCEVSNLLLKFLQIVYLG